MDDVIQPLRPTEADLAGWSDHPSWQHRLAMRWVTWMPRGKGWFPRWIGRHWCVGVRDTILTASGARLAMDCGSLDIYCAVERRGGIWESHVLRFCCERLKPGSVFYDIGANVGFMAVEISKKFDGRLRIFAFEPQPGLAHAIAVSAALNMFTDLHVYPIMLGQKHGEAELFMARHSTQASSTPREGGSASIRCPIRTLDYLVETGALPPPDVIKIDVEGGEWDALHGAERLLAKHKPIIVFESDVNCTRFGYTRRQLCEYLHNVTGHRFFAIRKGKLEPAEPLMDDKSVSDFAAIPPGKPVQLP